MSNAREDAINYLAAATQVECGDDCSPALHREEARTHVDLLLARPGFIAALCESIDWTAPA